VSSIVPLRREPTTPCFILDGGTVVAGSNQAWSCSASTFWPDHYIKRWFYTYSASEVYNSSV